MMNSYNAPNLRYTALSAHKEAEQEIGRNMKALLSMNLCGKSSIPTKYLKNKVGT